jgi:BirA family biotin operon repressor/biotin-[acetyl-CoA-carboxylase] ligase
VPPTTRDDTALLALILETSDPAPAERLARTLGWRLEQILDTVQRLRATGCIVEIDAGGRVHLVRSALEVWRDALEHLGPPKKGQTPVPRLVEIYRTTSSTQDALRRLVTARGLNAHGAIVAADEQTAGRGRLGRRWVAPAGSAVLLSLARVGPSCAGRAAAETLLLAATVGVCEALEAVGGVRNLKADIKWPNDVLCGGRKIAGILVESFTCTCEGQTVRATLLGVGINVSLRDADVAPQLRPAGGVTSLLACGVKTDRLRVLCETVRRIEEALDEPDTAAVLDKWRARSTLLTRRHLFSHNAKQWRGQVVDLDPALGLIIRTESGSLVHLPGQTTTVVE